MNTNHNKQGSSRASRKTGKSKNIDNDHIKLNIAKTYLCGNCSKDIIENAENKQDESIECTICCKWFHRDCTPLTSQVFDIMSTSDNIKFFCPQCDEYKGKENKDLKLIMQMMEKMEERIMNRMENIIEKRVEDRVMELERKLESHITKKLDGISTQSIEFKIKTQVEETLEEQNEIKSKINNIVIFNLEEGEGSEEEKGKNDLTLIKEIIGVVAPELKNESQDLETSKIKRLGKMNPSSNKPRPLKVELPDELFKNNLIHNGKKLKRSSKFNSFPKKRLNKKTTIV